ncbi:MAG: hypothetical protein CL920_38620 [Deltaproteobacteria bacterium]|nr:hypothetical protein [Deltaproteobacteria bacterium]|tara:strand:+ start:25185 stop:26303 length:1119 start_codon:yes stop_codon:yes gene_type:complete
MSTGYDSKFHDLLYQAESLKDSASQIMLLEEAIRLADSHSDPDLGFMAREALIKVATFGGYPEKALVCFTWCLAQSDQNPQDFPPQMLLWPYKWVALSLAYFPQLSRTQINEILDDLTKRFKHMGISLRPIHNIRCRIAWALGDLPEAVEHRRNWQAAERDEYSDCIACEMDNNVEFLLNEDQDEQAIRQAEPILTGAVRCAEVPHHTYARILLPLFRNGQYEEAARYHLTGYRLIQRNRDFLGSIAEHMLFLVLTENMERARGLFEKHLQWALDTKDVYDQLQFFSASSLLFEQLQKTTTERSIPMQLPASFPGFKKSGQYNVRKMNNWLGRQVKRIIESFDKRNGNHYFTQQITNQRALLQHVHPFPIEE